jgi:hypothetical protein
MRKKAERDIRQAAARLDEGPPHRIDRVRKRTGLLRKVFDKTLLHMARVGTIQLHGGPTDSLTREEVRGLIPEGDRLHVGFTFLDNPDEPPAPATDPPPPRAIVKVDVTLEGLDRDEWERFEHNCRQRENLSPDQKIREMIVAYNRRDPEPDR